MADNSSRASLAKSSGLITRGMFRCSLARSIAVLQFSTLNKQKKLNILLNFYLINIRGIDKTNVLHLHTHFWRGALASVGMYLDEDDQ